MIRRLVERRQEYCDGCGSCRRERHSIVTINVFTVIFLFFVLPATSMAADARSPSLFVQHHRRLSSDATDNNNAATTTLSSSANTNDDSGNDEDEECMEAEKCQMCTFSDQKSIPACQQTGRMQKFTCHSTRDDGTTSQEEVRYEIRSCQHTEADEEFGMVSLFLTSQYETNFQVFFCCQLFLLFDPQHSIFSFIIILFVGTLTYVPTNIYCIYENEII